MSDRDICFVSEREARKYFEKNGFYEYQSAFAKDGVLANYQKKYRGEQGVKYYIEAELWRMFRHDDYHCVVEFSGQFYKKGTHDAVNMTFLGWRLKDVEAWADSMLEKGLLEPYSTED